MPRAAPTLMRAPLRSWSDDESSHSSCFEVDERNKNKTTQRIPESPMRLPQRSTDDDNDNHQVVVVVPSSKPQKKVHFDDSATVSHDSNLSVDEMYSLWYTPEEHKQFKLDFIKCTKQIIRFERPKTKDNYKAYLSVMHNVYKACQDVESEQEQEDITRADERMFNKWIQVTESRLGLERACNRVVAQDKTQRRHELLDAVLHLQDEFSASSRHHCSKAADEHQLQEEIRKACVDISRPSRLFARRLGSAHALAA